jgi:hypothetical protein
MYTKKCFSAIKESEIMSFAGKWVELELIILNGTNKAQKAKYHSFCSYVESKPNIIIIK